MMVIAIFRSKSPESPPIYPSVHKALWATQRDESLFVPRPKPRRKMGKN